MTALERIKEIEILEDGNPGGTWKDPIEAKIFLNGTSDRVFLLRAFHEMRKLANECYRRLDIPDEYKIRTVDEEFEWRMK